MVDELFKFYPVLTDGEKERSEGRYKVVIQERICWKGRESWIEEGKEGDRNKDKEVGY